MKNKLKENKGITLIALIVTVIVLLILAAVTLRLVLGQNGVIDRTKESKTKSELSTIKEELELEKTDKITENKGKTSNDYGITLDNLNISQNLKDKYKDKIVITSTGEIYYNGENISESDKKVYEEVQISDYSDYTDKNEIIGDLLANKFTIGTDSIEKDTEEYNTLMNKINQEASELEITDIEQFYNNYKIWMFSSNNKENMYAFMYNDTDRYLIYAADCSIFQYISKTNTAEYAMYGNLNNIVSYLNTKFEDKTLDDIKTMNNDSTLIPFIINENNVGIKSVVVDIINDDSAYFIINGFGYFRISYYGGTYTVELEDK